MNEQEHSETEFERRLRAELTAIVSERAMAPMTQGAKAGTTASRLHGARLGLAAAAVAGVAVAALVVNASSGDTPPAFAVEARPEGMVSVEIRSPEDPQGLEEALADVGIPASVAYLQPGMTCKEPRFQAAPWPKDARTIVVGPPQGFPPEPAQATIVGGLDGAGAVIQEEADGAGPVTFWISRAAVGAGQTLVVTASVGADGVFDADTPSRVALAEGAVSRCQLVPVGPGGDSNSGD